MQIQDVVPIYNTHNLVNKCSLALPSHIRALNLSLALHHASIPHLGPSLLVQAKYVHHNHYEGAPTTTPPMNAMITNRSLAMPFFGNIKK